MDMDTYHLLSLRVQVITSLALIATLLVYLGILFSTRRASVAQNILSLVNFLQAERVRDARTTVRDSLQTKPYSDWDASEQRDASLVCSSYDVASILIYQQKLVPAKPFTTNWGPSIIDCYEICKLHIEAMQKESGSEYWNDFAILYAAAGEKPGPSDEAWRAP